jgi:hypothetical protein
MLQEGLAAGNASPGEEMIIMSAERHDKLAEVLDLLESAVPPGPNADLVWLTERTEMTLQVAIDEGYPDLERRARNVLRELPEIPELIEAARQFWTQQDVTDPGGPRPHWWNRRR